MATKRKIAADSGPHFDVRAALRRSMDDVAKRQGLSADPLDDVTPMSTGWLMLDLMYGGGIRPAMYTHAGEEQTAKTTLAISEMAQAIKLSVPLIAFWDYEGCVTSDTLIGYGKGKHARLDELFDLSDVDSWKPGTWPGQTRTDIDTVEPGHRYGGTGVRRGSLFYKGKKRITTVTFNTGHSLSGHGHKMFVMRNGVAEVVKMENLHIGEQVLVQKNFLEQPVEEWRPVKGYGDVVSQRYRVSNYGRVKSIDFDYNVVRTFKSGLTGTSSRTQKGRELIQYKTTDGHCWVKLCDGETQRHALVHRLVAQAFIGPLPMESARVLHWNDDPEDNRLSNLHYGTDIDNNREKALRRRAPAGVKSNKGILTDTDILEIRQMYADGFSGPQISAMFGVSNNAVYAAVNGLHKTLIDKETVPFEITDEILCDFELAAVTSIEDTGEDEHVFDISLRGVNSDVLPHSIITNGVVTHNSTKNSRPYIGNVLKTMGVTQTVDEIFGKVDKETGEIIIRPLIDYFATGEGEKFFDWLAAIEREFPDKRYIGKKWWLVYTDTKENKAKYSEFADSSMTKRYGKGIWIPASDGNLQGLVIVDAWSAMNPDSNDDEEADNSLGVQARFFTKHLNRIKGRLAPKMIALIGMNHLADIPMAMYGPKQKEKGGNELRAKSDCRIWNYSRSSGMPFNPTFDKDEGCEVEPSVTTEGYDRYRYILSKNIKNKLWTPKRKAWFRIWMEDGNGDAQGFDPFFDTMCYLSETGQLIGNVRKKLKLNLDGIELTTPLTNWADMKKWVLGTKEQKIEICQKLGIAKPFDLRNYCFKQMATGKGEALYVKRKNEGKDDQEEASDD